MKKTDSQRVVRQYVLIGVLWGIVFLVAVILLDLFMKDFRITYESVLQLHYINPILWIIDLLPFILGYWAYRIGKQVASNINKSEALISQENEKSLKIFNFVEKLRSGEVNAQYEVTEDDELGKSLVNLRDELRNNREEENQRKREDTQRHWITEGLAKFGEILRESNKNIEELANNIIRNLVKYIDAQQAGFFVLQEDENKEKYFELAAMFAYERKKFANRRIEWGEGLIGSCAMEKQTVLMQDVPDGYVKITSGLGRSNPRCVLLVPLQVNENVLGVLEFASFKLYEPYEIEFVERLAESIAATLSNVRINMRTEQLLKESQLQAEIMARQEEVMRRNVDVLKQTQEEAAKQSQQFVNFTNSVNHTLIRAEYAIDGTLIYANTKFLELLGYEGNSEVEGKHISMFINKKDREWFDSIWQSLAAGGKHFEGDMKHVTKQNTDVWTMATYVSVRNERREPEKILFLGIDTTEAKKQSLDYEGQIDALNRSNIKSEYTPDGHIIDCNSKFLQSLGYEMSELENKSVYHFIDRREIQHFRQIWQNVSVNRTPFEGQLKHITKSGEEKWFHGTYTAVNDMYGDIAKIIYVANDIAEQKRIEMQSRRQTEQLREQEKQLQQSQIELSRKLKEAREEMKSQFREMETVKVLHEKTLEALRDAVVSINRDNIVEFFNRAAEDLWGLPKDDVLGRHIDILLPSDLQGSEDNYLGNYFKVGETLLLQNRNEVYILNKSGEKIPVLVTLAEAKFNDRYSLTAFIQNIQVELF